MGAVMTAASAVATVPVMSQVVMDSYAITSIISNINSLYNNIFTFVAAVVTLGGVVFPIVLTRYQNKNLRINQKQLTDLITSEIASTKAKLIDDLKKELALDVENLEKNISQIRGELDQRITESSAGLNAKAHHAQANINLEKGEYHRAVKDYLIAASEYISAKDENNLNRIIPTIISSLKHVKQEFLDKNEDIEKWFKAAIDQIETLNQNGRYLDDIQTMKVEFKEAKSRN
jgi:hypothetical protein